MSIHEPLVGHLKKIPVVFGIKLLPTINIISHIEKYRVILNVLVKINWENYLLSWLK